MSQKVLLPCPKCQHPNPVEFRQAGQLVKCIACNHSIDAPKLRELKLLAPGEPAPQRVAPLPHSQTKGWLFVLGLGMAVIAGLGSWTVYQYSKSFLINDQLAATFRAQLSQDLDKLSPAELWSTWDGITTNRVLPDWDLAVPREAEAYGQSLQIAAKVLAGAAGLGMVLVVSSFFLGTSRRPAR